MFLSSRIYIEYMQKEEDYRHFVLDFIAEEWEFIVEKKFITIASLGKWLTNPQSDRLWKEKVGGKLEGKLGGVRTYLNSLKNIEVSKLVSMMPKKDRFDHHSLELYLLSILPPHTRQTDLLEGKRNPEGFQTTFQYAIAKPEYFLKAIARIKLISSGLNVGYVLMQLGTHKKEIKEAIKKRREKKKDKKKKHEKLTDCGSLRQLAKYFGGKTYLTRATVNQVRYYLTSLSPLTSEDIPIHDHTELATHLLNNMGRDTRADKPGKLKTPVLYQETLSFAISNGKEFQDSVDVINYIARGINHNFILSTLAADYSTVLSNRKIRGPHSLASYLMEKGEDKINGTHGAVCSCLVALNRLDGNVVEELCLSAGTRSDRALCDYIKEKMKDVQEEEPEFKNGADENLSDEEKKEKAKWYLKTFEFAVTHREEVPYSIRLVNKIYETRKERLTWVDDTLDFFAGVSHRFNLKHIKNRMEAQSYLAKRLDVEYATIRVFLSSLNRLDPVEVYGYLPSDKEPDLEGFKSYASERLRGGKNNKALPRAGLIRDYALSHNENFVRALTTINYLTEGKKAVCYKCGSDLDANMSCIDPKCGNSCTWLLSIGQEHQKPPEELDVSLLLEFMDLHMDELSKKNGLSDAIDFLIDFFIIPKDSKRAVRSMLNSLNKVDLCDIRDFSKNNQYDEIADSIYAAFPSKTKLYILGKVCPVIVQYALNAYKNHKFLRVLIAIKGIFKGQKEVEGAIREFL